MTLDAIDITGFKSATLRDQMQPSWIWSRVEDLVIDRQYQREVTPAGRRAIQRIADDWDWKKYQPIIVAPTSDGRYAVVDGQHRAHAAAVVGLEVIPAMVVPMTPAEQAAGFVSINRDRIKISAHSIYRAELAAGAAWAVEANDAVWQAGCFLATSIPSAATKKPGVVFAIGLVRKMVENGEGSAITAGLSAIRQSDSGEIIDSYGGPVLSVWLPAIARNNRFLSLDLPAIFDELDIQELIETGRRKACETGVPARKYATEQVVSVLTAHKASMDIDQGRMRA